jgi:hypothetical protein
MLLLLLWILLAVVSLPAAILALLLYPVLWVLSIPLRIVGISVRGSLGLVGAIVTLPARLVRGARPMA